LYIRLLFILCHMPISCPLITLGIHGCTFTVMLTKLFLFTFGQRPILKAYGWLVGRDLTSIKVKSVIACSEIYSAPSPIVQHNIVNSQFFYLLLQSKTFFLPPLSRCEKNPIGKAHRWTKNADLLSRGSNNSEWMESWASGYGHYF